MEGCGKSGHVGRESGGGSGEEGIEVVCTLSFNVVVGDGGFCRVPAIERVCGDGVLERDGFGLAADLG